MRTGWCLLVGIVAAGCAGDKDPTDPTTDETDTDTDSDTDSDADTDTDTDTDADTDVALREPRFDAIVPTLLEELDVNLASAASIAVLQDGALVWVEGFGSTDPEGSGAVTPETIFAIGSTTKQMTAALALQQVERGLYSTEDAYGDLVPDFTLASDPDWSSEASVHELLSHQGGLFDTLDWPGPPDDGELLRWHTEVYGPTFWANNPPGAFWNYSNPNFTLAGLLVEQHDEQGRAWPDILTEDLFAPLGMTRSFIRKSDVAADGDFALSTGVSLETYAIASIPMFAVPDPGSVRPAGLVWSTPTDMTRWGQFLLEGDTAVLSDELRAELSTPHVSTLTYGDHYQYGYGLFVWDLLPLSDGWYPILTWEHGGNTLSFTSSLYILPEYNAVISLLSNGYGDVFPGTIDAVIRAVIGAMPPPSDYTGEPLDLDAIDGHIGLWLDPNNVGEIEISEGGTYGLTISIPLLDALDYSVDPDLIPQSTDVWYALIDGVPYDLTFVRDPGTGAPRWLRNRAFVAELSETPIVSLAPQEPPSRAQIDALLESARAPSPVYRPR